MARIAFSTLAFPGADLAAAASLGRQVLFAQVKDARRDPARADSWQLVLLGEGEVPVREMNEGQERA